MRLAKFLLVALAGLVGLNSLPVYAETKVLSLDQAIAYGLEHNPNLQIMQDRIGRAQADLGVAQASFYPVLTTRLAYQHSDDPARTFGMVISQRRLDITNADFNHPGGVDNYRPEITASYALFRGGQDVSKVAAAEYGVAATIDDKAALRNNLVQAICAAFYTYFAASEQHKITLRSIDAVTSELQQSQKRYQAGSELKSDVLSLQVQLAEVKDAEIKAANAVELALASMKMLLGMDLEQQLQLNLATLLQPPEHPQAFFELLTQALQNRPEVEAANKRLLQAQKLLSAAKGAFLPRADAFVTYGSDSKDLDFSTNRDNVTAGVSVELDLFTGFRTRESVKQAEYQVAMAEKEIRRLQLVIENEVKSAYLKLVEALARLEVTTASVNAAEEALRMVNEQRKAEVVTVTRYIAAEVARDKAQALSIAAQFDALQAQTKLQQSTGYWKNKNDYASDLAE